MILKKRALTLFLGVCLMALSFTIHSQEDETEKLVELTGMVMSTIEKQPLVFASVINKSYHTGTITDTTGLFYLKVLQTDTIQITTIGYKPVLFCLKDSTKKERYFVEIKLQRQVFEIEAVDIRALSWKQFKYQITNMEIEEKDERTQELEKWVKSLFSEYELKALSASNNPGGITIPFSIKGKREKSRRKVALLERQAEIDRIIDEKYNASIVRETTKLDGEELLRFIQWCNFERVWLLKTNGYDIVMAIKYKYRLYKKVKNH